ncbi:hypothetical protein DYB32_002648 [Aphanomyces invadans]|uniref:BZIP domain-containing protein n=1 Tax=Aphanomyces invadans TaxID=157072 RepID=A0A418B2L8_9STRA|nr:hypothetical protein DYB32_002648 [Aphanomyces invadans]
MDRPNAKQGPGLPGRADIATTPPESDKAPSTAPPTPTFVSSGFDTGDIFREEDVFPWLFLTSDLAPLDQTLSFGDEIKDDDLFHFAPSAEPPEASIAPDAPPTLTSTSAKQHSLDGGIQPPIASPSSSTSSFLAAPKPPLMKRESTAGSSVASFDSDESDSDSDMDDSDGASSSRTTAQSSDLSKKKRKRLKRNRDSARESRKRRMARIQENELRLKKLELENLDLKMRLRIGKEAIVVERQEKASYKQKMHHLLQVVAKFIELYKANYSDYGAKRRETIAFHIARVRDLLLPTQVTKMCMYSVENADEVKMKRASAVPRPVAVDEQANLWEILAKELDITEAQQRQIFTRRDQIKLLRDNLTKNLRNLAAFEVATHEKNRSLDNEVSLLQTILTPQQATKFIIWVKDNPAFMYMLDQLVQSIIVGTDDVEGQLSS